MIPILYEANETAFANAGLCRLTDILSCVVTEQKNGIYECDFEYPVDGVNFDLITPGRIIYCWHDDTKKPQPFDIVAYTKPIEGIVQFHATHVSYRLSYSAVPGSVKNINSLSGAFTALKEHATPAVWFDFFTDKTESTGYVGCFDGTPISARKALGGVQGSILDTYGGEYEWDTWAVNLWRSRGVSREFTIRYGVNLLKYTDEMDYQGTYSAVIPFWKDSTKTICGSVVESGVSTYTGRGECVPLDLTDKFETAPTASQLNAMAKSVLNAKSPASPAQTISVDFVHLDDLGEYTQFADLLKCNLCDTIRVVFPAYGMEGEYKIVETVYDVLTETYQSMELGTLSTSLADALGNSGGMAQSVLATVATTGDYEDLLNLPGDYVVETGTESNWRYRKWKSGRIELLRTFANASLTITTATGSLFTSSAPASLSLPGNLGIDEVQSADVTILHASYPVFTAVRSMSISAVSYQPLSAVSRPQSGSYTVIAQVIGHYSQ